MKKVIFLLILQFLGIKTIAQSILLDPKKSSSSILELNSNEANKAGIKFNQLVNGLEEVGNWSVNSAIGVAVSGSIVYINNFSGNKIHKIESDGAMIDFITTGLDGPQDIVIGVNNEIFVSNFHAGSISKFTTSGVLVSTATGFSNPTGMTFDNNGNLFVANNGNGTISKIAVGGVITHNFITGLSNPYGIVYDSFTNKIFISNYSANEIAEANATTGGVKSTFKSGIIACTGITRNAVGDLIVAQASPNKIITISPNGYVKDLVTTTYPLDVAIDNVDNLYVANQTLNRLTRYKPKYETGSLLGLDIYGNVKKTNLSKNGYKLYLDDDSSLGIYASGDNYYNSHGIIGGAISGVFGYSERGHGIVGHSIMGFAGYFEGPVIVTGTFSNPSDFTLKREITPLHSSLQKLCKIGGYNYYWKDSTQNKGLQTGVIAQELQKILPELVIEDKDKKLSVNYIGLIPHLIEAIKELKNENEDLKAKIKQYDNRFDAIEAALK